jgi:hypothetical protein
VRIKKDILPGIKITGNGGSNGIVEFEEISKGTIIVEYVHHLESCQNYNEMPNLGDPNLVNAGSLRPI